MSTRWPTRADLTEPEPPPVTEAEPIFPYKIAAFLLTSMFGCVAGATITAGLAGWTDWQPGLLFPLLLLTFWVGFYRWVWLHERLQVKDKDYSWAITVSELVLLVVAARLLSYPSDNDKHAADFSNIFSDPIHIFSGQFFVFLAAMLLTFYLAREGARNVGKMYIRPYELRAKNEGREAMLFDSDRREALQGVNNGWRYGIGVMALLTLFGLFFGNQTQNVGPLELRPQILTLTTLYFVFGLLWNAWGRLRYLRTNWQSRRLTEPPQLVSSWSRYLLILLVIAAIPAILIPGGYTLNPLAWLDWLLSLFKTGTQSRINAAPPRTVPLPPIQLPTPATPPPPSATPPLDLSWLPLAVFWVVTVALLLYALRILMQTGLGRFRLPNFFLTRWLTAGWEFLLGFFRLRLQFNRDPAEASDEIINPDEGGGLLGFLRPERLPQDPRARVRYYYKKLLRKGTKAGLGRRKGMAAQEYAAFLQTQVADPQTTSPDLDNLTSRFQEARYSQHSITEEQAQQAAQSWQRLEPLIHPPAPDKEAK